MQDIVDKLKRAHDELANVEIKAIDSLKVANAFMLLENSISELENMAKEFEQRKD